MSNVDNLLSELCPDGVPVLELSTVAETISGLSGKTKADFTHGNARFVTYKNVFANIAVDQEAAELVKVGSTERQNALQTGDIVFTGSSETADEVGMSSVVLTEPTEPLYLNSFCFGLRFHDRDLLLPEFSKYLFRGASVRAAIQKSASGVTRINVSKQRFMKIRIPVPPVAVQREIAKALDLYSALETDLETELEAELRARQHQYRYYRDSLLSSRALAGVLWLPMGEVGTFTRGRRFVKNDIVEDGLPAIHYGEIYTHYGTSTNSARSNVRREIASRLRFAQPGDVVIAAVGETVEDVGKAVAWLGDGPVAVHDDCFAFSHSENPRFIAYCLQAAALNADKDKYVSRAKVKRLSAAGLGKLLLPVPPLDEQERIVAILDEFSVLVSDLSIGLPAELKARRQQYEYYRDRLLTFEESAA